MVRKKGKKDIREILKERKSPLYNKLNKIWPESPEGICDEKVSKEASIAGFYHCIKVGENLNLLIDDEAKEEMTDEQLFVLSAAACLQCRAKIDLKEKDYDKPSENEIYQKAKDYNLSDTQAEIISRIAGFQKSEDFEKLPSSFTLETGIKVKNIPLMAALLRLAAVLPKIDSVAPQQSGDAGTSKWNEDLNIRFWQINKGWKFSQKDENSLIYEFLPEQEEDYHVILTGIERARKEIMYIADVLKTNGYPYMILPSVEEDKIKEKLKEHRAGKLNIGMGYYKISEFDIFKGRNEEIVKIKALIKENPICLLTGECGIGKSSLISAGILPSFRREGWRFASVRPELKVKVLDQLIKQLLPEDEGKISSMEQFFHQLSDKYFQTNIIIVMDQFECLLNPHFSREKPEDFTNDLILVRKFPYIRFLISYRSDYEGKLRYLWNEIADDPRGLPCFPLGALKQSDTAKALELFFAENRIKITQADLLQVIAEDLFEESKKITRSRGVFPPFIQMVAEALRNYAKMRDKQQRLNYEIYDQEMGKAKGIIGVYLKAMIRQVEGDTYIGRTVLYCLVNLMGEREYRYLIAGKSYE